MESFLKSNPEIAQFSSMTDFIGKMFFEDLSVERIASSGGVCRSKCFSLFKKFKNMTPNEYLNDFRLQIGAELLCSSQNSVLQISESCGFNSQSYFSRLFLKKFGVTPISFRRQSFFSNNGNDRVDSQKELFDAISMLGYNFYKIIKVDLLTDFYSIVKPDVFDKPMTIFSKRYLHGWISEFSDSGKIYEEDKAKFLKIMNPEYTRNYFFKHIEKMARIRFPYRRSTKNGFRWAEVEIVASENFSLKNQVVFIFIRDIDDEVDKNVGIDKYGKIDKSE